MLNKSVMPPSKKSSKTSKKAPATTKKAAVVHNKYISVDTLSSAEMKDYFRYLSSPKMIFWSNFLAGTARGLGFVIGTVAVLGLATFIISQVLVDIPWVGDLFRWLNDWLAANIDSY